MTLQLACLKSLKSLILPHVQARREWASALSLLLPAQRIALFDLSSVLHGCESHLLQSGGMWEFLASHLDKNASGRVYLASATHRQLIQVRQRGSR